MGNIIVVSGASYTNNLGTVSLVDESTYDTDGLAYADTVGISGTGPNGLKRLRNDVFFKALKSNGLWTKITHLWACYGASFETAKINLKTPSSNPLILAAGSQAPVISNGVDFSSSVPLIKTGISLTPSEEGNLTLFVFNRTSEPVTKTSVLLGATSAGGLDPVFISRASNGANPSQGVIAGKSIASFPSPNNGPGLMTLTRSGNAVKGFDKGLKKIEIVDSTTPLGSKELGFGCYLANGATTSGSETKTVINVAGKASAFSDSEVSVFNSLIVNWLYDMGLISESVRTASL